MAHVLDVSDLHVSYGAVPALRGISFHVKQGEIVALVGPNGAGKTTAMHAISGLIKRNTNSIHFEGTDISHTEAHKLVKAGISQVPEGRGIFPNLTVMENLNLGTYLRNDKSEISKDKEWVMDVFPRLRERAAQIAGTLSGGELQMLSIARALMTRPRLLLLDEPSMGLAPIVVEEIFKTITQVNRENGTTILLVEQNALMALSVSHRAYVLEVGTVLYEGKSADLKKDEAIQKAYLGI